MTINIENYVRRLRDINFMQPLYEAIVNSLDAKATNIEISIKDMIVKDENKNDIKVINGFEIIDDGDGFTEKNVDSFFEMLSEKKEEGKLGSGRFIWLKVFDKIIIESKLPNKTIKINFCKQFKDITYDEISEINSKKETKIVFSNVNKAYQDKRPVNNVTWIKNKIEESILPKLLLLKKSNRKFYITIDKLAAIDQENLPILQEEEFEVKSNSFKKKEKFRLFYKIKRKDDNKQLNYYVAHGRLVKSFTSELKINKLPDKASSIMLLCSGYLDKHINDDRNNFTIDMNNESTDSPISLANINEKLKVKMQKVLLRQLPEIKQKNDKTIKEAIDEEPYLASYIKKNGAIISSKQDLIRNSKKEYEKDLENNKKDFKKILKDKKIDTAEYDRIIEEFKDFQLRELGRYIAYRQQIIERLKQLNDDNEKIEELFHKLFMDLSTDFNNQDSKEYHYKQNMWLLDDKFMSFSYIASNKTFNQISSILNKTKISKKDKGSDRPDLFLSFSDNETTENVDCLVIEIKGIGTSDDEKNKSITELANNVKTIRKQFPNIRNIYSYIITNIDETFLETINAQDFKPFLTKNESEFYYRYYENNNNHAYVISSNVIAESAHFRNKVFLDLLKNVEQ
jgi:hypothetical protein